MRPKPELPIYNGSLAAKNLLDWINGLEIYFQYDEVEEKKKVKFVVRRLKGNASMWWDSVKNERRKKKNPVIKSWGRMVAKMKDKFLSKHCQLVL